MNKILTELNKGDKFEIIGCEQSYRNLYLKQITESCACIGGEKLVDGNWKPLGLNYTITTGVAINQMEGRVEIVENKEKQTKDSPELGVVKEKGTRGRKPKVITLPEGEFTVAQVVELNKVSQPCANIHVNEMVTKGVLIISRTVQGRGRPQRFFMRKIEPIIYSENVEAKEIVEVPVVEAPVAEQVTEVIPAVADSQPVVVA